MVLGLVVEVVVALKTIKCCWIESFWQFIVEEPSKYIE